MKKMMSNFGYYLENSMRDFKMLRKLESTSPKEYGLMIQKRRKKKNKRKGR